MKRTGFKRKAGKPLKRSKLKKKSKQKISTIQNKLWEIIKQIVRHTLFYRWINGVDGADVGGEEGGAGGH